MSKRRKGLQLDPLTKLVTEPYQVENISLSSFGRGYWHLRAITNERYPLDRDEWIYVVVKGYTNEDFNFYQEDDDKFVNGGEEIKTIVQRSPYTIGDLAAGRINAKEICDAYIREHPNYDIISVKVARKTGTTINR